MHVDHSNDEPTDEAVLPTIVDRPFQDKSLFRNLKGDFALLLHKPTLFHKRTPGQQVQDVERGNQTSVVSEERMHETLVLEEHLGDLLGLVTNSYLYAFITQNLWYLYSVEFQIDST